MYGLSDNMVICTSKMLAVKNSFWQIIRKISYKFPETGQKEKNPKSA